MCAVKKNVLLVTLQDQTNYGNRLQNYALQTVLQDMGFEVTTPFYKGYEPNYGSVVEKSIKKAVYLLGNQKYMSIVKSFEINPKKMPFFIEFDNKYISNRVSVNIDDISRMDCSKFTYAVTGSDQVWHNWKVLGKKELEYFYLDSVEKEKRVAYAASFGFSEVPKADVERHKVGLMQMKSISCREQRGCELVFELTGRDAKLVPDPTFLLTADKWRKIEKKPQWNVKKPFLLRFMLGNLTTEYKKATEKIASERGLKIIDINSVWESKYSKVGPSEFVWLIDNADYVCTDSFHACVFSIIFHRNFTAFKRVEMFFDKMFGRIDTLLTKTNLKDAVFDFSNINGNSFSSERWVLADQIMHSEGEIGKKYLMESLR